jgi:hypothetical protein
LVGTFSMSTSSSRSTLVVPRLNLHSKTTFRRDRYWLWVDTAMPGCILPPLCLPVCGPISPPFP